MAKARGTGRLFQRGRIWWVQYNVRGHQIRESSGSPARGVAVSLLKRRLGEIGQGRFVGPNVERTTFEDLAGLLLTDYRINGRRSLDRMESAIAHLREVFGLTRALDISADRIAKYTQARLEAGAASATATVNRELAALKRMFRLGERAGLVVGRPYIGLLKEDNARQGFFEPDHFHAVLAGLPAHLKPVVEIAYITGWRVRSEILSRQWRHVDLKAGWLRPRRDQERGRAAVSVDAGASCGVGGSA